MHDSVAVSQLTSEIIRWSAHAGFTDDPHLIEDSAAAKSGVQKDGNNSNSMSENYDVRFIINPRECPVWRGKLIGSIREYRLLRRLAVFLII